MLAAFVELELLRCLRRRGTFWLWVLLGLGFGAAAAAPAAPLALSNGSGLDRVIVGLWFPESLHNALRLIELIVLGLYAQVLAGSTLREDFERGSWVLLEQCPVSIRGVLLARAAGVALAVLGLHAFLSLFLAAFAGFVDRSPVAGVGELLGIWLLSLAGIPAGFLSAVLRHRLVARGRLLGACLAGVTLAAIFTALHFGIRSDLRAQGAGLEALFEAFFYHQGGLTLRSPLEQFTHPAVPFLIVGGGALLHGVISFRLVVHRLARVSER